MKGEADLKECAAGKKNYLLEQVRKGGINNVGIQLPLTRK